MVVLEVKEVTVLLKEKWEIVVFERKGDNEWSCGIGRERREGVWKEKGEVVVFERKGDRMSCVVVLGGKMVKCSFMW